MTGLDIVLPLDKPEGPTSHDIVGRVRRALKMRRVGHCGTLDPLATGLLLVCVGRMTKLSDWLTGADKQYTATFRLGAVSDTADAQGQMNLRARGGRHNEGGQPPPPCDQNCRTGGYPPVA